MKIIKLTQSTTEQIGFSFGDKDDITEEEVLSSLAEQINEETYGKEIIAIQYVENKSLSGRIGYNRSDIDIRSKIESITAYVTIKWGIRWILS